MSSSDSSISAFGVFTGALGVLTIVPLVWTVVQSQLPPAKFKKLEQTLVDTETLLRCINEEGLYLSEMRHYEGNMTKFRSSTERIREETYKATTFWQQVCAWSDGLSSRIVVLCKQVMDVRANICERSADARARLSTGKEDPMSSRRGLLARFGRGLCNVFAFLHGRKSNVSAEEAVAIPGHSCGRPDLTEPACAQVMAPAHAPSPLAKSNAEPGRVVCSAPGTRPAKKHMHRVLRAISRLEPETVTSTHCVHKAALRKILHAVKRQRSVLSMASSMHTHRPRKSRGIITPSRTAAHIVVLRDSESESDDDSWEDEVAVSDKTDVAASG